MSRPSSEQIDLARRLLVLEGGSGTPAQYAAAAARIYDKLHHGLDPILGGPGVQALLERSTRLANAEFDGRLPAAFTEGSAAFQTWLSNVESSLALQAAETLFGTFLGLLASFIGERLSLQLLKQAWPDIEAASLPKEKE